MNEEKYLDDPTKCPFCESDNIREGECTKGIDHIYQGITCRDCKKSWTEEYTLTAITEG